MAVLRLLATQKDEQTGGRVGRRLVGAMMVIAVTNAKLRQGGGGARRHIPLIRMEKCNIAFILLLYPLRPAPCLAWRCYLWVAFVPAPACAAIVFFFWVNCTMATDAFNGGVAWMYTCECASIIHAFTFPVVLFTKTALTLLNYLKLMLPSNGSLGALTPILPWF